MCKKNLLILLVGENPLPNYIVAKYLLTQTDNPDLEKPTDIILMYSYGTKCIVENLKKSINDVDHKCNIAPFLIGKDQYKMDRIFEYLKKIEKIYDNVHVHYSSGTKTMSVSTVIFCKNYFQNIIISDIDPLTMTLCYKKNEICRTTDLSKKNIIESIYNVIDMYGYKEKNNRQNYNSKNDYFDYCDLIKQIDCIDGVKDLTVINKKVRDAKYFNFNLVILKYNKISVIQLIESARKSQQKVDVFKTIFWSQANFGSEVNIIFLINDKKGNFEELIKDAKPSNFYCFKFIKVKDLSGNRIVSKIKKMLI